MRDKITLKNGSTSHRICRCSIPSLTFSDCFDNHVEDELSSSAIFFRDAQMNYAMMRTWRSAWPDRPAGGPRRSRDDPTSEKGRTVSIQRGRSGLSRIPTHTHMRSMRLLVSVLTIVSAIAVWSNLPLACSWTERMSQLHRHHHHHCRRIRAAFAAGGFIRPCWLDHSASARVDCTYGIVSSIDRSQC